MNKINSKYELGKIFCNKLNVFNWDTQKNKINKKIYQILLTDNTKEEIKKAIEKIKSNNKIKYSIFPIFSKNKYAKEITKNGIIIE